MRNAVVVALRTSPAYVQHRAESGGVPMWSATEGNKLHKLELAKIKARSAQGLVYQ